MWTQDIPGVPGTAEFSDTFGSAMTFADFNGDSHDDLAVGVPFEGIGSRRGGAVNVIYGSVSGLRAVGSQFWSQNSPEIQGNVEDYEAFGDSLAASDLGNGTPADLIVGRRVGAGSVPGAEPVLEFGEPRDIKGSPAQSDEFGAALAVGAFRGEGRTELAIGAPGELDSKGVGALHLLRSSASGLTADGNQRWTSSRLDAKVGPLFGATLAVSP